MPSIFLRWTFYLFMFSLPYEVYVPDWLPDALRGYLLIARITGVLLIVLFLRERPPRAWRVPRAFLAFVGFVLIYSVSMLRSGLQWLRRGLGSVSDDRPFPRHI